MIGGEGERMVSSAVTNVFSELAREGALGWTFESVVLNEDGGICFVKGAGFLDMLPVITEAATEGEVAEGLGNVRGPGDIDPMSLSRGLDAAVCSSTEVSGEGGISATMNEGGSAGDDSASLSELFETSNEVSAARPSSCIFAVVSSWWSDPFDWSVFSS